MSLRPIYRALFLALAALAVAGFTVACGADTVENQAPTLTLNVSSEETYVVGDDVVQIQATATDPDDGKVSFEVVNRPERAELQTFSNSALFTWDPITSDVTNGEPLRLIFVAKDAQGERAEAVVNVTILAGNGTPKFSTASSKLYDPNSDKPLSFEVEVRDDDSRQVILSMPDEKAPEGASFQQVDDKRGEFTWNPSVGQRSKRVHSVTFVADDSQNDPVSLEVTIILQKGGGGGGGGTTDPDPTQSCEDTPIIHDPIGAQRTIDDYEIEASFSASAAAKYDAAYLYWTTDDAMNVEAEFESADMKIDGTLLRAAIPNLLLPEGSTKTVYYSICALDQEAPEDAEDAFVCVPGSVYFSFNAYSPDEASCVDDSAGSSFSSATLIPDDVYGTHALCEGSADFHKFTVQAGEVVDLYLTYSLGQQIDIKLYDDAQKQRDNISFSDCYGIAYIPLQAPDTGEKTWFVEVSGDDAPYQITAYREQGGGGTCGDEDLEPNDTAGNATLVFEETETFQGASICEQDDVDIYAFDMLVGDEVDASLTFTHANGDLDVSLFAPSQADNVAYGSVSVADGLSEDDNEQVVHVAEESGIYYLLVTTIDEPNSYDLTISTPCGDDDSFGSSNHSQAGAALIEPLTYPDLKMCAGRPDWYQRTGFVGKSVLAEVTVGQGARASDVDFSVYNANGRLETATVDGDSLNLDFTPTSQEQYFYKVSGTKDMIYELTFLD
jgi:hypothetical protein